MFKRLSKQDRQGVRKPSDVERKYDLGEAVETIRIIQESSVPENVLKNYYTKNEIDYKTIQLKEDLESQIYEDYRTVDGVIEWINPPMALDTEYRTTERWLDKPVYTQLVSRGAVNLGNTSGIVTTPISMTVANLDKVVRYNGTILTPNESPTNRFIPYSDSSGGSVELYHFDNSVGGLVLTLTNVFIQNGTIYIQVWYTKTE